MESRQNTTSHDSGDDNLNSRFGRPPPSRRRDKPQLSCNFCRKRKLKCDRCHPCSNCAKRDLTTSCTYPSLSVPQSARVHSRSGRGDGNVKDRIRHLEELVVSLMERTAPPETTSKHLEPSQHSLPEDARSPGRMTTMNNGLSFLGRSHWGALLDDIEEVKNYLECRIDCVHEQAGDYPNPEKSPLLLLGTEPAATREELIDALPDRSVVDAILERLFSFVEMSSLIVHGPSFMRTYERFWEDPSSLPDMWLALLYGMLALSLFVHNVSTDEGPTRVELTQEDVLYYRRKQVQALKLADYTKGQTYCIEALLFYYFYEHVQSPGDRYGASLVLTLIIRLAIRQGYHREEARHQSISVLQAEMRKRTWSALTYFDILLATQMGLPRMIQKSGWDTKPPHNLLDTDLDENTTELPPDRPETSHTPVLHHIYKAKLVQVLGDIVDEVNQSKFPPYGKMMELDKKFNDTFASVPEVLRFDSIPLETLLQERTSVILHRLSLDLIYHKGRCVLHREFLVQAHRDMGFSHSRHSAVDAAMRILQHQAFVYEASQPGCKLFHERWKLFKLLMHEFMLAATIIYLDLDLEQSRNTVYRASESFVGGWTREQRLQALFTARKAWAECDVNFKQMPKAKLILELMLKKLGALPAEAEGEASGFTADTPASEDSAGSTSIFARVNRAFETAKKFQQNDAAPPSLNQNEGAMDVDSMGLPSTGWDFLDDMIGAQSELAWELWDTEIPQLYNLRSPNTFANSNGHRESDSTTYVSVPEPPSASLERPSGTGSYHPQSMSQ